MKHILQCNSLGRIESLITVNGPPGMNAGLTPRPGSFTAEVEGLKIGSGEPNVEAFRKLVKDRKISPPKIRIATEKE